MPEGMWHNNNNIIIIIIILGQKSVVLGQKLETKVRKCNN